MKRQKQNCELRRGSLTANGGDSESGRILLSESCCRRRRLEKSRSSPLSRFGPRFVTRYTLKSEHRNPARHRRTIVIVFFPELFAQRWLLVKDDKQMDGQQRADHVSRDVPRVEQPGLPSDNKRDTDVHRITHKATEAFDDADFRRRDRRGCSASNPTQYPECGVEIDRNPDRDDGYRRPFFAAVPRRRSLP